MSAIDPRLPLGEPADVPRPRAKSVHERRRSVYPDSSVRATFLPVEAVKTAENRPKPPPEPPASGAQQKAFTFVRLPAREDAYGRKGGA
jgi:hypothetical protein